MLGDMAAAIREVIEHHAERICAPGRWRVWRDGDFVRHERLEKPEARCIIRKTQGS